MFSDTSGWKGMLNFFMLNYLDHGGIYLVFGSYNIELFKLLLIIFKWK